jgi:alpha-beta hydrolase superfamily lysophospholipase
LLLSGDEDPITHKGKDTKEIYEMYKSLGITDLSMEIIKEGRHVLLKELNKEEVYKIIRNWLNDRTFI